MSFHSEVNTSGMRKAEWFIGLTMILMAGIRLDG